MGFGGTVFINLRLFCNTKTYDPKLLIEFIDNLVDNESGFYFRDKPADNRQLFNGAMKIISRPRLD